MSEKSISDKKMILSNLFWGIIVGVLSYGINFLITPIITSRLGIDAYGFISLGNTIISYINIISVGLNSFSARYIAVGYHKGDIESANSYYSSILGANLCLSILIMIPALIIIAKLDKLLSIPLGLQKDVKILFTIILINYFLGLISGIFNAVAFIKNRMGITSKIKGISILSYAILLIGLFYFVGIKVYYVAFANMIGALIVLAANFYYSRILLPELRIDLKKFSLKKIKILISAGIYNSINSLGGTLGSGLDLLITNIYLSGTIMGQIAVGNQIGGILNSVITLVANAFQPKQLQAFSRNNYNELISYFNISMKLCGLIANVFWGCFLFLGHSFLKLWIPGQDCEMIYNISLIVIIGYLIVSVITPLYYVTTLTVKMKFVCVITVLCGMANVLSMLLLLNVSKQGAYIVVGTTTILNSVALIVFPYITYKYLEINIASFCTTIIKHFICSLSLFIIYKLIPFRLQIKSWMAFVLYSLFVMIGITYMLCWIQFDMKERNELKMLFVSKLKK